MTPPAPPPGFTGVRSRVLAHAQDGAHHVTLAIYTFDDPGHAPVDVPYVELSETHDGARPGRVMALSALVHLCQNASDDEVWAIGGRETPGPPMTALRVDAHAELCPRLRPPGRATLPAMASPTDPPPTRSPAAMLRDLETAAQELMRLHPATPHAPSVLALLTLARVEVGPDPGEPPPRT